MIIEITDTKAVLEATKDSDLSLFDEQMIAFLDNIPDDKVIRITFEVIS